MVRRYLGVSPGRGGSGRLIRLASVAALAVLALSLSGCLDESPQSTAVIGGEHNQRIWDVYNWLWIGSLFVFILVEGLLLYAIVRGRAAPRTAHGRPVPVHGNTRLEILWTVIPAIVIVLIGIPTLTVLRDLSSTPEHDNTIKVDIVGHQFYFEFRYPELEVSSTNTLHIPAGAMIDINLQSADVIHSFWVPRLAGKTDNVPGRTNYMWLIADEPGTYAGQCAEFCGLGHALMRFQVIAHEQEDFDAWVEEQLAPPTGEGDPTIGEQLVTGGSCAACHAIEGTAAQGVVGPPLTGFASRPEIAGVVENTPENLAAWLANPPAVKPGTAMPPPGLTEAQIQHVIAYLHTLE
ncbi:MAG TPA: cytochrome c oxidase subunit II [Thermomicrobiales bacterium]|nr:cytochrome c oxidase subunit II [Thermomicrobiales bacterium]